MIYLQNRYRKPQPTKDVLLGRREYILHEKLFLRGVKGLARVERAELFNILRLNSVTVKGTGIDDVHYRGWVINYRDWLSEFFVEFNIGPVTRFFAVDEQSIRDHEWNMYKIVAITRGIPAQYAEEGTKESE